MKLRKQVKEYVKECKYANLTRRYGQYNLICNKLKYAGIQRDDDSL
jgi:5S rRNA maturation endonuclease (ribonuclease M5)